MTTESLPKAGASWRWPTALLAWCGGVVGVIIGGVGAFDQMTTGSETGATMMAAGCAVGFLLCATAMWVRPRRPREIQKLGAITMGLWPFVAFGGFLMWQINMSAEMLRACEAGDGMSCYRLATRKARRDEPELAARLYGMGCELGHGEACQGLGVMRLRGVIEGDALAAFSAGCGAEVPRACGHVAELLEAAGDREGSIAAWREGCSLGDANACAAAEQAAEISPAHP